MKRSAEGMMERLLTVGDAAELTRLSRATLYTKRWRERVGLPTVRLGRALRFRQSDLCKLIARGEECPPGDSPRSVE